ncbi:MAG: sigma-54 dependent transcriptional regulator [Woeseiaceae bacterium]|nr:sigma-54 dependent transcriptional regulator [Woeseiaceae bacterium]
MSEGHVLIVEDDDTLRAALTATLEKHELDVTATGDGSKALDVFRNRQVDVVVSDVQMSPMDGCQLLREIRQLDPATPAILMTAYGTVEQAVDAMRLGASDYLVKPVEAGVLVDVVKRYLRAAADSSSPVAVDPQSVRLLSMARRVAGSDATVTISGESGCGKEVVARFIHEHSPRRRRPFVAINCAAIPENMLEAVLFGYEKGAFTGAASAHPGKFEQAQGGTLLLDEVSEMDVGLQAKLLRVIQEREVERLGGKQTIGLDVRVLATTNRDLKAAVAEGRFREDLYYRLNVFPLALPPLRERRDDIVPLAELAILRYADGSSARPGLAPDAVQRLLEHSWPGNVRELNNVVQRSLILLQGDELHAGDLIFEEGATLAPDATDSAEQLQDKLRYNEQQIIIDALKANQGNRKAVAEMLGISPRTLRYKLARLREAGISLPFAGGDSSLTAT